MDRAEVAPDENLRGLGDVLACLSALRCSHVAANFAFKRFVSAVEVPFTGPALITTLLDPSLWIGLFLAGIVLAATSTPSAASPCPLLIPPSQALPSLGLPSPARLPSANRSGRPKLRQSCSLSEACACSCRRVNAAAGFTVTPYPQEMEALPPDANFASLIDLCDGCRGQARAWNRRSPASRRLYNDRSRVCEEECRPPRGEQGPAALRLNLRLRSVGQGTP